MTPSPQAPLAPVHAPPPGPEDHSRLARLTDTFYRLGAAHLLVDDIAWALRILRVRLGDPESQPPRWFTQVQHQLDRIESLATMADSNLDTIAQDWPVLKDLLTQVLGKLSSQTTELAGVNAADPRGAELSGEMQTMIQQLQGVVATPSTAPGVAQTAAGSGSDTSTQTGGTSSKTPAATSGTAAQSSAAGTTGGGVGGSATTGTTTGAVSG